MFRSTKLSAVLAAALVLGHASIASGDAASDRRFASQLQQSLPTLVVNEQYRSLSKATMQLAGARSRLGETPEACKALSQSLESYRMAVAHESGVIEDRVSSIGDDSDGMAEVRARFGCAKV
jgi:predicted lipoprotein